MLIFPKEKVIFLHVPKTGGTTVRSKLAELVPDKISLIQDHKPTDRKVLESIFGKEFVIPKHATLGDLMHHIGSDEMGKYRTFAFVRNPFSRALSAYRFIKMKSSSGIITHKNIEYKISEMSFEDFLKSPIVGLEGKPAATPQTYWLPDLSYVDFVGRTENLSSDMSAIIEEMGLPIPEGTKFGRENVSGSVDEWRSMSSEARSLIRDIYHADFDSLGYDPELNL